VAYLTLNRSVPGLLSNCCRSIPATSPILKESFLRSSLGIEKEHFPALSAPLRALFLRNRSELRGIPVAPLASLPRLTRSPNSHQSLVTGHGGGPLTTGETPACDGRVFALSAVVTGVRHHSTNFPQVLTEYTMSGKHLCYQEG
jgi:hypothetical protein